jgi:uncharacterized iron-regulated membrane protein
MQSSQKILKLSRKIHLYVGVFIAPALLFFSFTGAVQTFNLHETTQGSSYTPPKWLMVLGQLHKKQTTVVPVRKMKPASASGDGGQGAPDGSHAGASPQNPAQARKGVEAPAPTANHHLPMKVFFLLVAVGLAVSTLTGIYMTWRYARSWLVIALLLAGIIVPCVLLAF